MVDRAQRVADVWQRISEEPPVDCEQVDIQELEEMSQQLVSKASAQVGQVIKDVRQYMQNVDINDIADIDIANAQYDPQVLLDYAQKIGLDFDDLEDYGFDFKNLKCESCPDRRIIFDFDKVVNGPDQQKLEKVLRKYSNLIQRASCHPLIKDNVPPQVQSILLTLPFAILTWPLGIIIDPCLSCICCPCECCYCWFFQIPWNTLNILVGIVVGLILGVIVVIVGSIAALFALVFLAIGLVLGIISWFVGLIAVYTAIPLLIPLIFEFVLIFLFGPLLLYFAWYWIGNSLGV